MFVQPQDEHTWLAKLVGEWTFESECHMKPGDPPMKASGKVICRPVGGLWVICEGGGDSPEGGAWTTVTTLGYDAKEGRYIGTFVGSMMSHLWIYSGSVDESGKKLTLDTEGPKCEQEGLAKYQDIVEIVDDSQWVLSSQILGDDGKWHPIMKATHRRVS